MCKLTIIKKPLGFAFLIVFLFSIFAFNGVPKASAATNDSAVVSLVKSGTMDTSDWSIPSNPDPLGTTFTLDIRIDEAVSVWGWTLNLSWSPSTFNLTNVKEGNYLKKDITVSTVFLGGSYVDNEQGTLLNSLTCAISRGSPRTDSSGVLATLTFLVVGGGVGNITLSGVNLRADNTDGFGTYATGKNATVIINMGDANRLDLFTDNGGVGIGEDANAYGPQDLVKMYARVTYENKPAADIGVSFIVSYNGTVYTLRVAQTNATGFAYSEFRLPTFNSVCKEMIGNWSIRALASVSQITLNDTVNFPLSYVNVLTGGVQIPANVSRLQNFTVKVSLNSLNNLTWSQLDVTLFDKAQVPIGSYSIKNDPALSGTVQASILIPKSAFCGQATAYICLLRADGSAIIPETAWDFEILPENSENTGLYLLFVVPEYFLGGLSALAIAFVTFTVFLSIKRRRRNQPTTASSNSNT